MNPNLSRIGIVLGALVASVGLTTSVAAKPGHGGFDRIERKLERLEISTEVESAALAIVDETRPEQRALRVQVREAREALHDLLATEPVDEAAVMAQADAVGALEHEARKLGLRTLLQVGAVLDAEDRAAFFEMGKGRRHR